MSYAASARRMLLGLQLTLMLALGANAQGTDKAALGDVTLTDGRTFKSVVVISQSSTGLNVRHAGGITKLDKRLLPPELQARYPVDGVLAAKEENEAAAARERAAQEKQRKAAADRARQVSEQAAKQAGVDAAGKTPAPGGPAAGTASLQSNLDRAAHAPNGLFIVRWVQTYTEIQVTLSNPTTTSQKFDFRQLQGLVLENGGTVVAQDVKFLKTEIASYWVDGGQERTFRVTFPTQAAFAAISWTGPEEWRLSGGVIAPIAANRDAAIQQKRETASATKAANRARGNEASAEYAKQQQEKNLIGK